MKIDPNKSEHNSNQEGGHNLHHHINKQTGLPTDTIHHIANYILIWTLCWSWFYWEHLYCGCWRPWTICCSFFTDQKLCNSSSERYRISLRYSHLYASLYFFSFFFFHFFLHHYTCVAAWHGRWGRDVGTLADLRSHPQAPTEHNFSLMIIFFLKPSVMIITWEPILPPWLDSLVVQRK